MPTRDHTAHPQNLGWFDRIGTAKYWPDLVLLRLYQVSSEPKQKASLRIASKLSNNIATAIG